MGVENEDEEVPSPPWEDQQLKEVQIGEEKSAIPAWLKQRLPKEVIAIEEEPLDDSDNFLHKTQEVAEKRKVAKMSNITRDDIGSWGIQIATPRVEKLEGEITTKEYDLETIYLVPPTTKQAMEDLNETMKTVHDMLKVEVEKNKKLEKEVNVLRSYLQQFKRHAKATWSFSYVTTTTSSRLSCQFRENENFIPPDVDLDK